jgi:hypothetical protein
MFDVCPMAMIASSGQGLEDMLSTGEHRSKWSRGLTSTAFNRNSFHGSNVDLRAVDLLYSITKRKSKSCSFWCTNYN